MLLSLHLVSSLVTLHCAHMSQKKKQDRRLTRYGDTLKELASFDSISSGDQGNLALGSLSTGSPAGRAPLLLTAQRTVRPV